MSQGLKAGGSSEEWKESVRGKRILVVSSTTNFEISALLQKNVCNQLKRYDVQVTVMEIPSLLEIPTILRLAVDSGEYDGFVTSGCVLLDANAYQRFIADQLLRVLIDLGHHHKILIGNALVVASNRKEAEVLANGAEGNAGIDAVETMLALIRLQAGFAKSSIEKPKSESHILPKETHFEIADSEMHSKC